MNLNDLLSPSRINAYLTRLKIEGKSEATLKRKEIALRKFTEFASQKESTNLRIYEFKANGKEQKKSPYSYIPKFLNSFSAIPTYFKTAAVALVIVALGLFAYDQIIKRAKTQLAYPTTLQAPGRVLSFQGRLTDEGDTPIGDETDFIFRLYDAETDGNNLWTSNTCTIDPDQDGIFSARLGATSGADACGGAIDPGVFTENTAVWLEVQTEAETLTPRQPIATAAYALNSETLQGFPPGTSYNNILYIDNNGNIGIGITSPILDATSSSGTFTITGQSLLLQTPDISDGDIAINPDGEGVLDLIFEGSAPSSSYADNGIGGFVSAINANLISGAMYYGEVASIATGYDFIQFMSGATPTEKFSVNDSGSLYTAGNIGIGTSASAIALYVGAGGEANYADGAGDAYFQNDIEVDGTIYGNVAGTINPGFTEGSVIFEGASGLDQDPSQFFWDNDSNYLGIGTSTPTNILTVAGNSDITGNLGIGTTNPYHKLDLGSSTGQKLALYQNAAGSDFYGFGITSGSLNIHASDGIRMVVKQTGLVGIGTTVPQNKLDVSGSAAIGSLPTSALPQSNMLYVSGNVGIGTTSPAQTLHVVGTVYGSTRLSTAGYVQANDYYRGSDNGNTTLTPHGTGDIVLSTDSDTDVNVGSGQLFINGNSGNVGIGTTAPSNKLSVAGGVGIGTTSSSSVYHTTGIAPDGGLIVEGNVGIGTTDPAYKLDVNGDIQIASGSDLYSEGTATLGDRQYTEDNYVTDAETFTASIDALDQQLADVVGGVVGLWTDNGDVTYLTSLTDDIAIGGTGPEAPFYFDEGNELLTLTNTTADLSFRVNDAASDTSPFVIDADGNVGIGLTNPSYSIDVKTGIVGQWGGLRLWNTNAATNDSANLDFGVTGSDLATARVSALRTGAGALTALTFHTFNAASLLERMRIDANGNVGIGTTEPGEKLEVAGNIYLQDSNKLLLGTGKDGEIYSSSDNLYIANVTQDKDILFNVNDGGSTTTPLFIDGSTSYVGIGTTGPTQKLHIVGNSIFRDANNNGGITLTPSATANLFRTNDDGDTLTIGSGDDLIFQTYSGDWTTRITIKDAGNVGIGTTAPSNKLSVAGGVGIGTTSPSSVYHTIGIAPDGGLIVEGNVGIGTTGPGKKLDVNGDIRIPGTSSGNKLFLSTANDNFYLGYNEWQTNSGAGLTIKNIDTTSTGKIYFQTGTTLKAAFDNSGNLGIGTTGPTQKLHIVGNSIFRDANNNGGITLTPSATANLFRTNDDGDTLTIGSGDDLIFQTYSGDWTTRMTIKDAGNVGIGTTAPTGKLDIQGDEVRIWTGAGTNTNALSSGELYVEGDLEVDGTLYTGAMSPTGSIIPSANDTYDLGSDALRWANIYLGAETIHLGTSTADEYAISYNTTTDRLGFNVNGSGNDEIVFNSSGNVGIGTTGPGRKLEVFDTTNPQLRLTYTSDSIYSDLKTDSSGYLQLLSSGNRTYIGSTTATASQTLVVMGHDGASTTQGYLGWYSGGRFYIDSPSATDFLIRPGAYGDVVLFNDSASGETREFKIRGYRAGDASRILEIGVGVDAADTASFDGLSNYYFDGNVGIGTAAPDTTLELETVSGGGIKIDSAGTALFTLDRGTTSSFAFIDFTTAASNNWRVGLTSDASSTFRIATNSGGSTGLFINTSGNVGIGNTAPDKKLTIGSKIKLSDETNPYLFISEDGTTGFYSQWVEASNYATIYTGGASYPILFNGGNLYVGSGNGTGNVGIGTTAPYSKLSLGSGVTNKIAVYESSTGTYFRGIGMVNYGSGLYGLGLWGSTQTAVVDNGNAQMLIDIGGNVGIGTTSPSYKLDVNGDIRIASGSDLHIGSIGIGDSASSTTSGAYLVGAFDEFDYSASTNVQDVLDDIDAAISTLSTSSGWVLAGDAGTPETLGIGDTGTFAGGVGIGTIVSATDTLTITFDSTELGDLTWGSGSPFTWTLDVGATDPTLYTTSGILGISNADIGIGTTNPTYELDVVGDIGINGSLRHNDDTDTYMTFADDQTYFVVGNETLIHMVESSQDRVLIGDGGDVDAYLGPSSSYTFIEGSSGNVGIGTTDPLSKLTLVGTSGGITEFSILDYSYPSVDAGFQVRYNDSNGSTYLDNRYDNNNADIYIRTKTAGTAIEALTVKGTGNIGIGTTGPASGAKLQVITTTGQDVRFGSGTDNLRFLYDSANTHYIQAGSGGVSDTLWFTRYGSSSALNAFNVSANTSYFSGNVGVGYANPGTANLAVSGNVGIGTTAPLEKLSIGNGNIALNSGSIDSDASLGKGLWLINSPNSASPGYSYGFDLGRINPAGSGIYTANITIPSTAGIGFRTYTAGSFPTTQSNFTYRMLIDQNGNVGIGTTAPTQKLHIVGNSIFRDANNNGGITLTPSATANLFRTNDDGDTLTIGSGDDLIFQTYSGDWTTRMTIKDAGNVGIGTTNPQSKLSVAGGNIAVSNGYAYTIGGASGDEVVLTLGNNAGTPYIQTGTTRDLNVGSSSFPNSLFIEGSNGNVGIGTTGPTEKLEVYGDNKYLALNHPTNTAYMGVVFKEAGVEKANLFRVGSNYATVARRNNLELWNETSDGDIVLLTNSVARLTIDHAGNVGIGVTGPTQLLDVNGNLNVGGTGIFGAVKITGALFDSGYSPGSSTQILKSTGTGTTWVDISAVGVGGTGTTNYVPKWINLTTLGNSTIFDDGNVGIGTTTPYSSLHVVKTAAGSYSNALILTNLSTTDNSSIGIDFNVSTSLGSYVNSRIAGKRQGSANGVLLFSTKTAAGSLTEQMIIDESGNVGIGTTVPKDKLVVNGSSVFGAVLGSALPQANSTYFAANVGIGTTAPSQKLDVVGEVELANYLYFGNSNSEYLRWDGSDFILTDDFLPSAADTNNLGSTAYEWNSLYVADGSGLTAGGGAFFGSDQDFLLTYDETTSDALEFSDGANTFLSIKDQSSTADFAFNIDDLFITNTGNVGIGITAPEATFHLVTSASTGYGGYIVANSLTSGSALYLSSTATGLTTGSLLNLDWSPTAATTATGDLVSINIGSSGNIGNILNIKDSGSSLFSVSETAVTSNIPASFTSSGDVSLAYDLIFTNQTASNIKTYGPFTIENGESFESNDLTLKTYNYGDLVLEVGIGVTSAGGTVKFYDSNVKGATDTTPIAFAAAASGINTFRTNYTNEDVIGAFNEVYSMASGASGGIWTDGGSFVYPTTAGSSSLYINDNGNVGIGTSAPVNKLTVSGNMDITGNLGIGTTTPKNKLDVSGAVAIGSLPTAALPQANMLYVSGNVGIGTTGPNSKLAILDSTNGAILSLVGKDTSNTNEIRFYRNLDPVTYKPSAKIVSLVTGVGDADYAGLAFYTHASDNAGTEPQEVVRINHSGNVGIGTTAPTALLNLASTAPTFQLTDTTSGAHSLVLTMDGNLAQFEGVGGSAPDLFVLDIANQRVGIGTTAPSADFNVNGTAAFDAAGDVEIGYNLNFSNDTASYIRSLSPLYIEAGDPNSAEDLILRSRGTGDVIIGSSTSYFYNNGDVEFKDGSTSRFFVDISSGSIGIGITAPVAPFHLASGDGNYDSTPGIAGIQMKGGGTYASMELTGSDGGYIDFQVDIDSNDYDWRLIANAETTAAIQSNSASTTTFDFTNSGAGTLNVTTEGSVSDYAETIPTNEPTQGGDILIANESDNQDRIIGSKARKPYDKQIVGIVSTKAGSTLNIEDASGIRRSLMGTYTKEMWEQNPYLVPLSLAGRVPVKISVPIGKKIERGDSITSSYLAGIGQKANSSGITVAKTIEPFDPQQLSCVDVNSVDKINWPEDDGTNPAKPCFRLPDGTYIGKVMVLVGISWHDPDAYLTEAGSLAIQGEYNYGSPTYTLKDKVGDTISRIGAFGELVAAKIKSGFIQTKELTAENKVVSPLVETNEINLKSQISNLKITAQNSNLNISDAEGETTAQFDTDTKATSLFGDLSVAGDVEFSGNVGIGSTLSAKSIEATNLNAENANINEIVADNLEAKTASFSAVYADEIITRKGTFGDLLADKIASVRAELENLLTNRIANFDANVATDSAEAVDNTTTGSSLGTQAEGWSIETSNQRLIISNQGLSDEVVIATSLIVQNKLSVEEAFINKSLLVGNIAITENGISTLADTLYLQPAGVGKINLLAGAMVIEDNGNIAIKGDLTIGGKVIASEYAGRDGNFAVNLAARNTGGTTVDPSPFGRLIVKGENGNEVASIDASGSATFTKLNVATASAEPIIAASSFGELATESAKLKTNATAGEASIPVGKTEIVLYTDKLTAQSLVYVTPTTDTGNQVLFVKSKEINTDPEADWSGLFTVAIKDPAVEEIKFNWWIIN